MMMLERVRQRAPEFDVLHFHLDYFPFSLFSRQSTPFVTTLHGRLDLPELQPVFDTFSSVPVVSISNSQRRPLPQARWPRRSIMAYRKRCLSRRRSSRPILLFSDAFRRKSASTARSGSPSVVAFR